LLLDETRVRLICIERANHVIAIGPGVSAGLVFVIAVRFAVVGDVEPVASPTLAVSRRGEQPVDEVFIGLGRGISGKGFHFSGGGRQSVQVVSQAADQGAPVGFGGRRESFVAQFREHERVDRRLDPWVVKIRD
jgi:hypothetical protein